MNDSNLYFMLGASYALLSRASSLVERLLDLPKDKVDGILDKNELFDLSVSLKNYMVGLDQIYRESKSHE